MLGEELTGLGIAEVSQKEASRPMALSWVTSQRLIPFTDRKHTKSRFFLRKGDRESLGLPIRSLRLWVKYKGRYPASRWLRAYSSRERGGNGFGRRQQEGGT